MPEAAWYCHWKALWKVWVKQQFPTWHDDGSCWTWRRRGWILRWSLAFWQKQISADFITKCEHCWQKTLFVVALCVCVVSLHHHHHHHHKHTMLSHPTVIYFYRSIYLFHTGDGLCAICNSFVNPDTLVHICDECNYGSLEGRCVICGLPGVTDAYYCRECVQLE